jgi:16S rRNA processing protein RimM
MPQENDTTAGSLQSSEPAFLVLGKLRRPHGIQGEIPVEIYSEMLEFFEPGCVLYVGDLHQPFTVDVTRWKGNLLLVKFKEISDRTLASSLTNALVYIKTDQLPPLADSEFYYHEIIGMDVYEENGEYLGVLKQVLDTGANDVYLIQDELGGEVLLPAIDDMIIEINDDQNKIIVAHMEWYGEGD